MTECLDAEGATESMAWLAEVAKCGVLPIHRRVQNAGEVTPGELGSTVELQCDDVTVRVQMIEDTDMTSTEFWALPNAIEEELASGKRRGAVTEAPPASRNRVR